MGMPHIQATQNAIGAATRDMICYGINTYPILRLNLSRSNDVPILSKIHVKMQPSRPNISKELCNHRFLLDDSVLVMRELAHHLHVSATRQCLYISRAHSIEAWALGLSNGELTSRSNSSRNSITVPVRCWWRSSFDSPGVPVPFCADLMRFHFRVD